LLVGVATLGVYGGAEYVGSHPDSSLVQTGSTVYQVTRDGAVIRGAVQLSVRCCRKVMGESPPPPPAPDHATVAPAEPTPMEPASPRQDEFPAWVQGIDPIPADEPPAPRADEEIGPCPGVGFEEESEPTVIPAIPDDDKTPCKMPYSKDEYEKCVGFPCAWLMDILSRAGQQVLQIQVGKETGGEQSSLTAPGQPPSLREDPEAPYQYPECPHLGGCPRCTPAPQPTPKKQSGNHSAAPKRNGNDECPAHPEVDTTEFRPSDARHGEFDRIPF
jgi:hypothetical protein